MEYGKAGVTGRNVQKLVALVNENVTETVQDRFMVERSAKEHGSKWRIVVLMNARVRWNYIKAKILFISVIVDYILFHRRQKVCCWQQF